MRKSNLMARKAASLDAPALSLSLSPFFLFFSFVGLYFGSLKRGVWLELGTGGIKLWEIPRERERSRKRARGREAESRGEEKRAGDDRSTVIKAERCMMRCGGCIWRLFIFHGIYCMHRVQINLILIPVATDNQTRRRVFGDGRFSRGVIMCLIKCGKVCKIYHAVLIYVDLSLTRMRD